MNPMAPGTIYDPVERVFETGHFWRTIFDIFHKNGRNFSNFVKCILPKSSLDTFSESFKSWEALVVEIIFRASQTDIEIYLR